MAELLEAPQGDAMVPAVNPQGQIVRIQQVDFERALGQGFKFPTPDQLTKLQAEEQARGPLQGAAAFGEGATSALTFGISPGIETALGLTTPQAIAARKEVHPVLHGAGTAAGIVAPLIATMGADAPLAGAEAAAAGGEGLMAGVRTAAEYTAPSLIARAGRAAARATEGVLPGAVGKILPALAAGATEGGLYAGADVTEKALLGDPQLTWEGAASELGLGALFGGALAGGADVGMKGLGKLITKATSGLESVASSIAKGDPAVVDLMFKAKGELSELEHVAPGATEAISTATPETAQFIVKNAERIKQLEGEFPGLTDVLSRATPATGKQILDNWGQLLKDPQARIDIGNSLTDAVNTAYTGVEDALRKVNSEVRPEEIERLTADVDPGRARTAFRNLHDKVDEMAKTMRAEPDLYQQGPARELELITQGMRRDYFKDLVAPGVVDPVAFVQPPQLFTLLNRTKQLIDAQAKFGKLIPPEWRRTADALKDLRGEFKRTLESKMVWGEAGERQAAFNQAQNAYFTARNALTNGPSYQKLMQKVVTKTGAVEYEANPRSVNSWINLMADGRGGAKSDSFASYLKAARNLSEEMEKSGYGGAADVRKMVDATAEQSNEIRQRGTITQLVKMLQGHEILSSGPAIPMHGAMLSAAKMMPGATGHIVGHAGHMLGTITGTISKARDPSVTVGVISALDKYAKRAATKLNAGAAAIFRSGAGGAAAGEAAGGAQQRFAHGGMVMPEKFTDVSAALRHYGGNLDALAGDVSRETSGLEQHAPSTTTHASAFAARLVQHLGSKLPDAGQQQFLDEPFEPSSTELAEYNRHHEVAVRGPIAVLEHVANGTLLPEHLETSQLLYPKLHAEAQQLVAERLAAHVTDKKPVPLHVREGIGMLLGTDLDHSSTGDAVLSAQSAYGSPAPLPAAVQPPAGGRARNVDVHTSQRLATGSQGNEIRMGKA